MKAVLKAQSRHIDLFRFGFSQGLPIVQVMRHLSLRQSSLLPRIKRRAQSGATLVEGALVFTIVATLIFAVLQFAFLIFAYVDARNAANVGARIAEVNSSSEVTDYHVVKGVLENVRMVPQSNIKKIVVFNAINPNGKLPGACENNGVPGKCNVYFPSDFHRPESDFAPGGAGAANNWPSNGRVSSRSAGTDYVGITVSIESQNINPLLPIVRTFSESAVNRIQPLSD